MSVPIPASWQLLQFAHSDLSRYSVFEEAFGHGNQCGLKAVLRGRGLKLDSICAVLVAWLRRFAVGANFQTQIWKVTQ